MEELNTFVFGREREREKGITSKHRRRKTQEEKEEENRKRSFEMQQKKNDKKELTRDGIPPEEGEAQVPAVGVDARAICRSEGLKGRDVDACERKRHGTES